MSTGNKYLPEDAKNYLTFAQPELRNWLIAEEENLREPGETDFARNFFNNFSYLNMVQIQPPSDFINDFYKNGMQFTEKSPLTLFYKRTIEDIGENANVYLCDEIQYMFLQNYFKNSTTKRAIICHCSPPVDITLEITPSFSFYFFLFSNNPEMNLGKTTIKREYTRAKIKQRPILPTTIYAKGNEKFYTLRKFTTDGDGGTFNAPEPQIDSRVDGFELTKKIQRSPEEESNGKEFFISNNMPENPSDLIKIFSIQPKARNVKAVFESTDEKEVFIFIHGQLGADDNENALEIENESKKISVVFTSMTSADVRYKTGSLSNSDFTFYTPNDSKLHDKTNKFSRKPQNWYFAFKLSPLEQVFRERIREMFNLVRFDPPVKEDVHQLVKKIQEFQLDVSDKDIENLEVKLKTIMTSFNEDESEVSLFELLTDPKYNLKESKFVQMFQTRRAEFKREFADVETKIEKNQGPLISYMNLMNDQEMQQVTSLYKYIASIEYFYNTEQFRVKKSNFLSTFFKSLAKNEKSNEFIADLLQESKKKFESLSMSEKKDMLIRFNRMNEIKNTKNIVFPFFAENVSMKEDDIFLIENFDFNGSTDSNFDLPKSLSFPSQYIHRAIISNEKSVLIDFSEMTESIGTLYIGDCDLVILKGRANDNVKIVFYGKIHTVIDKSLGTTIYFDNVSPTEINIGTTPFDDFLNYSEEIPVNQMLSVQTSETVQFKVVNVEKRSVIRNFHNLNNKRIPGTALILNMY